MFAVVICAKAARQAHLKDVVDTYRPSACSNVESRVFATAVDVVGALVGGTDRPAFVLYSLAGGGLPAKDMPLLQGAFPGIPIIVEFAENNDDPGEALELIKLGVYNVYSERINRAQMLWDMFTRAIHKREPYERIPNVAHASPNWGFMSMIFAPGSLDYDEYLFAIRPVTDALHLELRRVDEISSGKGDLRQRVQDAIRARDVLVAQMSTQSSNTMYEIGCADMLGKPIILLRRTGSTPVPALLHGHLYVEYSTSVELAMRLFFGLR